MLISMQSIRIHLHFFFVSNNSWNKNFNLYSRFGCRLSLLSNLNKDLKKESASQMQKYKRSAKIAQQDSKISFTQSFLFFKYSRQISIISFPEHEEDHRSTHSYPTKKDNPLSEHAISMERSLFIDPSFIFP